MRPKLLFKIGILVYVRRILNRETKWQWQPTLKRE